MGKGWKRFGRRYVQLMSAVLYNCNWKGFAEGRIYQGKSKGVCVPGLNCYSCPGAVGSCPLGSLQTALISSKYRFPYYILGTILLMGLVFGRVICAFLCPFGFLQELLYRIPTPKLSKNRITRGLSCVKYVVLIVLVLIFPLVLAVPGFCKYICPAGTLEAGIPLTALQSSLRSMTGVLFSWKLGVLLLILAACALCHRAFCRFLCPLGAIYSLMNPVSFFGIKVDQEKCIHCDKCVRNCRMDVKKVCDRECIQCGECMRHCPVDAIHYGFKKPSCDRGRRMAAILSLALFLAAVVLLGYGAVDGGFEDVKNKAIRICLECMGIG